MRFTKGNLIPNPDITVIPGYHLALASMAMVFKQYSISFIRLISFFLNFLSVPIFYLTVRKLDSKHAMAKTLQYSFFPLFFPFFPLIYTDILSNTTILFSLFFVLRRNYSLAGLVGLGMLLTRQNNVIWLLFLFVVSYHQEYGFRLKKDFIKQHLYRMRVFIIVFLLFVEFVIVNGGFVWGNKAGHPVNYVNVGNVYFMFFLSFIFFMPFLILQFKKVIRLFVSYKSFFLPAILLIYGIFMLTFSVTHPWNRDNFHLHNLILKLATTDNLTRTIFFLPMIYAMIAMFQTSLYKNYYAWIFPLGMWVTLPGWIIEQRYYMVFFTLFILFRKYTMRRIEVVMLVVYILVSFYLFEGILHGKFFL